jgi:mono/diheme cytochrome c family protein
MIRRVLLWPGLLWLPSAFPAEPPEYERDIAPVLETHCVRCHGSGKPQASLDARTRAGLIRGGVSGAALTPGSPEKSPMYTRIRAGEMPLGGQPLPQADVERIRAWIEAGAPAAQPAAAPSRERPHWAFLPPARPAIPGVRAAARVRNPVDAFVLARLEKKGLTLSPDASRETLLRRLSLDLTGIPPTPAELDAFLADRSATAYEAAVDRLLSSPRYGERWGRQWLDAAGYAESEGVLAADVVRPDAWRYRDYVIRSLNHDKPYDQFVREQLAGDEISEYYRLDRYPPAVVEALEATGFLRTAVDATRDDFLPKDFAEYQWRTFFDTEQIAVSALMGLTIQCARCHDHQYEPLTQRDYYALQAVFAGALRPEGAVLPGMKRSIVDAPKEERERAQKNNEPLDQVIKALRDLQAARLAQYRAQHPKGEMATEKELKETFPEFAKKAGETAAELKDVQAKRIDLPTIRALADIDAEAPVTHILKRGDPLNPGDPVAPGVPAVLDDAQAPFRISEPPKGAKTTGRRLAFARWLTRPDHPLTARVIVNRVWAGHFGRGIVPTLDNFGRSGAPPSNPELLDWLSTEFVRQGWSLKTLHKTIVTSSVYRQSSAADAASLKTDPENVLLWRMPPRRLEAEAIRDSVLAVSGALDETMFGPPVKTETKPSGEVVPEHEEGLGRRSVYQTVRRSAPQSLLNAFDAPVMEINCTRRAVSTSATQALALMNGAFVTAQAERFAGRVRREAGDDDSAAARHAFRLALGRPPSGAEMDLMLTFLKKHRSLPGLCQALLSANEFVYID